MGTNYDQTFAGSVDNAPFHIQIHTRARFSQLGPLLPSPLAPAAFDNATMCARTASLLYEPKHRTRIPLASSTDQT
jgi:hypothetical protein